MTRTSELLLQVGPRGPTGPHGPAGPNPGPHGPMPYGGPGGTMPWEVTGNGLGPLPGLLALFVLLAVLVAVAYLVWRLAVARPTGGDEALRVLETRYARGEVDDEEFERRRERLAVDP